MSKPAKSTAAPVQREAMIREAAYFLYENDGCVDGRELEHWVTAEALIDETLSAPATPAAPADKRAPARAPARTKRSAAVGTAH